MVQVCDSIIVPVENPIKGLPIVFEVVVEVLVISAISDERRAI